AMATFDPTNQSMQHTEPEMEFIIPRMKVSDDMFVSIDGKWVNEIYCQPPFVSHRKLFSKKAQNEWSIWEENRALWEENHVLWIENRMLWEEIKALQRLQSQNKAVPVVYTEAIQQSLQKEKKAFPFFQEMTIGFQASSGNKALQAVQENNRVLEDIQKEHETASVSWEGQKDVIIHEEYEDASSNVHKDTSTITDIEGGIPGPMPQQKHGVKKKSTIKSQNVIQCASDTRDDNEILRALQDLYKLLHIFLKENPLHGEKQDGPMLCDMNKSFQEEYNKLRMQLNAIKNTVSGITAQMEMLENELIAITSPVFEEAG
ncbi:SPERT protein, partial [Centropus unirufus]|nr:SPERT protein [Centropus unirufus]